MPYIPEQSREKYYDLINQIVKLIEAEASRKGAHNFVMFEIAARILNSRGLSYETIQDIIGTFAACESEFARRLLHPYEDRAIFRNGDLAPLRQLGP